MSTESEQGKLNIQARIEESEKSDELIIRLTNLGVAPVKFELEDQSKSCRCGCAGSAGGGSGSATPGPTPS